MRPNYRHLRIAIMAMVAAVFVPLGKWPSALADKLPKPELPARVDASSASSNRPVHDFARTIKPLLITYCYGCHNANENKGELDLAAFSTAEELAADAERLEGMLEAVSEGFMPPKESKRQPSDAHRKVLVEWLRERLHRIAMAQAGDPGKVVLRRLTNAELNYTLTDLTGVERDWTEDFPRDSSGGEGFSNTGQTLQMSASQIEKYLALAQRLADHALMLPGSGPVFLETPVSTLPDVERARLALARLDDYCRANDLAYKDVTPRAQITSYAYPDDKPNRNEGYSHMRGYKGFSSEAPGATLSFVGSTFRLFYRTEKLNPTPFSYMIHRGAVSRGPAGRETPKDGARLASRTWANLWFDLRYATAYARPAKISLLHQWFSHKPYRLGDNPSLEKEMRMWKVGDGNSPDGYKRYSLDPAVDLSFTVIALADYIRGIRSFSPDELKAYSNIQQSADGESRTLMVPNHDAFDAFIHLSLNNEQIEALWRTVCDPTSKLAQRLGGVPSREMQRKWKAWTEQQHQWHAQVLPASQEALSRFAARAWRRPLSDRESKAIHDQFKRGIRQGQPIQKAMWAPLMRVFMSPHFLYRMEFGKHPAAEAQEMIRHVSDYEIASRLSYFLWSSIPDQQLWDAADRGELSEPEHLAAQTRRMRQDPRIRRFSREMFGQWLRFYRFSEFDLPDPQRHPEFDTEMRNAMHNEAIDFCADLMANDRDIRLLLNADYAFLSRRLARHYGVPIEPTEEAWAKFESNDDLLRLVTAPRISLANSKRRGVLGWGAVLTTTSHALRTSPVLRGNWILDDLIGIPTPPPPNAVPELPEDEKNGEGLTVAELLARHREDKACAVCHDRIDPFGLALENYDPIGRYRRRDLNGAIIDAQATFHDGTEVQGADGLIEYLQQKTQRALFAKQLTRKMLGYALGREILPGDAPLLERINATLGASNYRISRIVESIVTSSQFRTLRYDIGDPRAERN